eukprot:1982030-Prymnesium_polylepis.1
MAALVPPATDRTRAAQLPAPRTIAPSREDVLSNLAFFFGDPVVSRRVRHPAVISIPPIDLAHVLTVMPLAGPGAPARLLGAPRHVSSGPLNQFTSLTAPCNIVSCAYLYRPCVRRTFHFPDAVSLSRARLSFARGSTRALPKLTFAPALCHMCEFE